MALLLIQELWQATQARKHGRLGALSQGLGDYLSTETVLKVLERLPRLLASSSLKGLDLATHLEQGQAVEASALPTNGSEVLTNEVRALKRTRS